MYEGEKYYANIETVMEVLEEYGVAIIPSILSEYECEKMFEGFWDFFEKISENWDQPINRDNEESWRGLYSLYPLHSMLIQYWGIGHAQVSWNLREHPGIVDVFSRIWDCQPEDLLVSFDGLSFAAPPEVTNKGWYRGNTWFHSDQSFTRNEFECVQSWVTALDVEEGDATLSILEGSHKYHKRFGKRFKITEKDDWYKLSTEEEKYFVEKGCEAKRIVCPKGSLVLWDSRTIHCGVEAERGRENSKFRAVSYLCYQPREKATEAQLVKKRRAFNEKRTTTHYPCKAKLFAKSPRTYGGPVPDISEIDYPILTELGVRLAGF